ncbi:MAG TPA: ATP-dependent DNA helicase RecG [Gaiellaceae bacterium]|nr:ATP-dependent DNA helicase RecG [Gaiellaceae bacterium]
MERAPVPRRRGGRRQNRAARHRVPDRRAAASRRRGRGVVTTVGFAGEAAPSKWPRPRGAPRPGLLDLGVETLPRVGPSLAKKLGRLGLRTVRDLLEHRPHRYEEPVPERPIGDVLAEEEVAIAGEVRTVNVRRPRRRLALVEARISDGTGEVKATWFNQAWLAEKLQPGTRVRLRGSLGRYGFTVKSYDLDGGGATADFAPVYPATEDLTPKRIRELVAAALDLAGEQWDPLPAALRVEEQLPSRSDALRALHQPAGLDEAETARKRLAFDELLVFQLGLARRRAGREAETAPAVGEPGEVVARYRALLPFTLTEGQERAIAEIDADLAKPKPMERLLQGDVGSGKTVVALYALLRAAEAGLRGALMAPTETLAEQHFLTVEPLCRELGIPVGLLTSSVPARERVVALEARILVGTHALIQEDVDLSDLAVAVVDEQHRFGVEQRKAIAGRRSPHVLHMTATPIPRTLALTVYGDLAVSEIAKPPANRKPIVTAWVTEERSSEAYKRLRKHLDDGRQAYVVCPLIEESETSLARAAEREAERLRNGELRGYRVGLLHGRLRPAERRDLMAQFNARELDVLVATTVIEVGVDVPNATIMIVQEADRFGLAQLHQLRGRVGRGAEQSYCLLVSRPGEELTDSARERLEAMVRTTDGFELAEVDLDIRGEGQLLGTRQAGLSDLRFTRLRADRDLIERAREAADELVGAAGPLDDEVERFFADREPAA